MVVMFGNREHSFTRHISPAKHVLEKRDDVFFLFRTSKGNNQDRVICGGHSLFPSVWRAVNACWCTSCCFKTKSWTSVRRMSFALLGGSAELAEVRPAVAPRGGKSR